MKIPNSSLKKIFELGNLSDNIDKFRGNSDWDLGQITPTDYYAP